MLLEYGIAVLVAGVLYTALIDWVRKGMNNVWNEHLLEQRATMIGLWLVPLAGAVLLALYYGARFIWWRVSDGY